jgi:hypothetical protein
LIVSDPYIAENQKCVDHDSPFFAAQRDRCSTTSSYLMQKANA